MALDLQNKGMLFCVFVRGDMIKAFIMAAGIGSRLSRFAQNRPKCLLRMGDKTLISRTLDILGSRGIKDITIVTGFRADLIQKEVGDRVRYVHNPFFHITNSIASLWFGRDFLEGDCLIMNADLFFEEAFIDELLLDDRDKVMLCDSTRVIEADYRFTIDQDHIVKYGKNISVEDTDAEYCGIAKIRASFIPYFRSRLCQLIDNQQSGLWWEDVLYSFIPEGKKIYVHDIAGIFWGEVDYVEDYERINRWVTEHHNKVSRGQVLGNRGVLRQDISILHH